MTSRPDDGQSWELFQLTENMGACCARELAQADGTGQRREIQKSGVSNPAQRGDPGSIGSRHLRPERGNLPDCFGPRPGRRLKTRKSCNIRQPTPRAEHVKDEGRVVEDKGGVLDVVFPQSCARPVQREGAIMMERLEVGFPNQRVSAAIGVDADGNFDGETQRRCRSDCHKQRRFRTGFILHGSGS